MFSLLVLIGCTTPKYSSLTNPNVDFEKYTTFYCINCLDAIDTKIPRYDNVPNREALRAAIQNEMEKRGHLQQEESPDLLVLLEIHVEDYVDTTANTIPSYRHWKGREVVAYNYRTGTVKISLVDRVESTLIWQGSANGILDKEPQKSVQRIDKAVEKIFNGYPIQISNN